VIFRSPGAVSLGILVDVVITHLPAVGLGGRDAVGELSLGADFVTPVADHGLSNIDKGSCFHGLNQLPLCS
jgi:hypothetical protein